MPAFKPVIKEAVVGGLLVILSVHGMSEATVITGEKILDGCVPGSMTLNLGQSNVASRVGPAASSSERQPALLPMRA